jgi:hypothetical protein
MSELRELAAEAIAPHKARLQPTQAEADISLFMARRVRDAIEDIHVAHLPDDVMPNFNRSVRDAIVESLVAMRLAADDDPLADAARRFLSSPYTQPPEYWEPPQPSDEFQLALGMCTIHGDVTG